MKLKNSLIVLIIITLASCSSRNEDPSSIDASIETFEMLESVFEGPYSKYAIKDKLDEVFAMYDIESKQSNYLKVGNSLVDFKKDSNGSFREIDILTT